MTQIGSFLCPAAEGVQPDPLGFGQTSYMPISYCDIDPATGLRAKSGTALGFLHPWRQRPKAAQAPGALQVYGNAKDVYGWYGYGGLTATTVSGVTTYANATQGVGNPQVCGIGGNLIANISDGSSNTIMIGEDSSYRNHETVFPFQLSPTVDPMTIAGNFANVTSGQPAQTYVNASGKRAINRWADPESSNGVSGPPEADPSSNGTAWYNGITSYPGPWINQNAYPLGGGGPNVYAKGGVGAPWSANNCGPNDELFSPHNGGLLRGIR